MRVSKEEAAATRARIVRTAGRLFRRKGFDGTGIDDVMTAAGLTHGGFYRHFPSKDALIAEACASVLQRTGEEWAKAGQAAAGSPLDALVDRYLTAEHRDAPDLGCIFAALGGDAGRKGDAALTRRFAEGLEPLIDALAAAGPEPSDAERRQAAVARLATLVGALVLARATAGTPASDEILRAARAQLLPGTD